MTEYYHPAGPLSSVLRLKQVKELDYFRTLLFRYHEDTLADGYCNSFTEYLLKGYCFLHNPLDASALGRTITQIQCSPPTIGFSPAWYSYRCHHRLLRCRTKVDLYGITYERIQTFNF